MLYTSEIVIFVALGVLFAAGLAVIVHWSGQKAARIAAYALISVAFLYVGFGFRAEDSATWVGIEMTGVAIFGSLAMLSMMYSPWFAAAGLALHTAWALGYHYFGAGSAFTPAPLALGTAGFDVAAALYVAFMIWREARAPKLAQDNAPQHQLAARSRNRQKDAG